jgi:hypothetical protein
VGKCRVGDQGADRDATNQRAAGRTPTTRSATATTWGAPATRRTATTRWGSSTTGSGTATAGRTAAATRCGTPATWRGTDGSDGSGRSGRSGGWAAEQDVPHRGRVADDGVQFFDAQVPKQVGDVFAGSSRV